jgi:hypothetical protein
MRERTRVAFRCVVAASSRISRLRPHARPRALSQADVPWSVVCERYTCIRAWDSLRRRRARRSAAASRLLFKRARSGWQVPRTCLAADEMHQDSLHFTPPKTACKRMCRAGGHTPRARTQGHVIPLPWRSADALVCARAARTSGTLLVVSAPCSAPRPHPPGREYGPGRAADACSDHVRHSTRVSHGYF